MKVWRACAVVPTFNNPLTLEQVVFHLLEHGLEVVVVDDASAERGKMAAEKVGELPGVHLRRREHNGGKGAAVQDGLAWANHLGFTHALQVDADGQHALEDATRFLEASRKNPDALILGYPVFDESVPHGRLLGRQISIFWCTLETLGRRIQDPLCGFRVYPLDACMNLARPPLSRMGARMEFDPEIAVRLVWSGTPTENLPTRVRYPSREEGGVSHFRLLEDNVRISWMHTRLVTWGLVLLFTWPFRRLWRSVKSGGNASGRAA